MSETVVVDRVNGNLAKSLRDASAALPSADLQRMYRAAHAAGDRLAATQLWEKWVAAKCREGDRPDALRRDVGTPVERFWACVVEGADGHLFWDGPRRDGKPVTATGKGSNQVLAQRFAWKLKHGDLHHNFKVFATCGEANCLNADHLATGHGPTMNKQYRHEALIGALQACSLALGKTPTIDEYDAWRPKSGRGSRGVPTSDALITRLGSWLKALDQAGLPRLPRPEKARLSTDEEMISAMQAWSAAHGGKAPTSHVWKKGCQPPAGRYFQRWGSWANALEAAGLA